MSRKIGIIANIEKPHAGEALRHVASHAIELGVTLFADEQTVKTAGGEVPWKICAPDIMAKTVSAIAVLGGDGTLLRAVHQIQVVNPDIPLMGMNIGNLGYLTSVEETQFGEALKALADGTCEVSERQMLSCEVRKGDDDSVSPLNRLALNEIVISRGSGRLVKIELSLNGQNVTTYACDGLIVSTPTGSTAYSLSAGGPLVMPGTAATVITVICPHTLSSRPLVVSDSVEIALRIVAAEVPLPVSIDGEESAMLSQNDSIFITRGNVPAKIAFLPGYSDYQVLSRKLGLNGQNL